ncbi:uncharacterized protein [Elaeis guineensis]|uniref:FAD synthase n=1 Tax=Elaeis guineensis var. tenera TaxID=51953 RepID=A0A6I9SJG3_ELAGV|nr:FAD synthase isoform X2 [Elaeis guineensis]
MDIDRAIKESSDRRLQTKYHNAVYVIQRTFSLYEFEQVAFSFNGGKDSTVLLHLLRAGYYLHKGKTDNSNGNQLDCMLKCPIRTIYFESPCAFPEINSFTYETAAVYDLHLEIIRSDFKSGLETLLKEKSTKAIFLGTRIGDPNAVGQEQFSPSSTGWPPFMRVNPILDWSYRDVWAFILTCKVKYCSLYDQGFGTAEDQIGATLCKKLQAIGWQVAHVAVVQNDVDSVAEEVEHRTSKDDMVFLFGGLGPLHSDVSMAGVAKAFGVRLAPDEEFEEYLRHLIGDHCTGDRNEMALLPEGITELLHHEMLPVPLIKCRNVIILAATNVSELETEWECLLQLPSTPVAWMAPFMSKHLSTMLSDIEAAQIISKLCIDFSDIYIGCHRKSRVGPLIINFVGKDNARIELAAENLCQRFPAGVFCEVKPWLI